MAVVDILFSNLEVTPDMPSSSLQVQCVLYELPFERARKTAEFVDNAAGHAIDAGRIGSVRLALGDCSASPTVNATDLADMQSRFKRLDGISAVFFGENLGHGGGHNRLMSSSDADLTLILNPDVLVAPDLLVELLKVLARPRTGLAEARQLPSEHPKDFDPDTGKTSWCSGACLLGATGLIREAGGFDAASFFLYGDDVDLSWRVRLAGYDICFQPTAICYHDKRVSDHARWQPAAAERYYSAEAGLMLAHKYSRPDLADRQLRRLRKSGDGRYQELATTFEERRRTGRLPTPLDSEHKVAQFIDGDYASKRFQPR